jgi:hypothetical protein
MIYGNRLPLSVIAEFTIYERFLSPLQGTDAQGHDTNATAGAELRGIAMNPTTNRVYADHQRVAGAR